MSFGFFITVDFFWVFVRSMQIPTNFQSVGSNVERNVCLFAYFLVIERKVTCYTEKESRIHKSRKIFAYYTEKESRIQNSRKIFAYVFTSFLDVSDVQDSELRRCFWCRSLRTQPCNGSGCFIFGWTLLHIQTVKINLTKCMKCKANNSYYLKLFAKVT